MGCALLSSLSGVATRLTFFLRPPVPAASSALPAAAAAARADAARQTKCVCERDELKGMPISLTLFLGDHQGLALILAVAAAVSVAAAPIPIGVQ